MKHKANLLYGSYYQESSYIKDNRTKPSRAYRMYVKEIKNEWNRNPNNAHTK